MAEADVVVLCLPDDATKETVALADELGPRGPRIIDASTAHRIHPDWVFGFREMTHGQAEKIAAARRVANPGCYPTGGIALIRPLVEAGLMPADYPVTVNAVSGYSGGGKSMIETFETGKAPFFEVYGLDLAHKHVPELQHYGLLTRRPNFVPSVGNFRQGMLVSVPLHLDTLPSKPKVADLHAVLAKHFAGAAKVRMISADDAALKRGRIETGDLNGTDLMELRVFGLEAQYQAVLVAKFDNLGKGASGAAVQCLGLMLGINGGGIPLTDLTPFLSSSAVIDSNHPSIRELANFLRREDQLATVRSTYELVRDRFPHSYDIGAVEVSVSASDVLRHGHGICFAKSHLLAALLRANRIPAGLCYQKLARDDQASGRSCLHGLNAVWLDGSWRRLDPRGNKPNTAASFDPDCERLAYSIDAVRGERDYRDVFAEPLPCVLAALRGSCTVAELDRNLPTELDRGDEAIKFVHELGLKSAT